MGGLSLPDAWERWDQRPSDELRARQLIDAEKAAGQLLGITHMAVHMELVGYRREGMSYDEAIDALRAAHEVPES